jgi:hypothetical protein
LRHCRLKRREICESYFFDSGCFLDSCWFEERGRLFRPGIYFAELKRGGQELGSLRLPDPSLGTPFDEYAHGAAAWFYDDHAEDASEIQTGDINSSSSDA